MYDWLMRIVVIGVLVGIVALVRRNRKAKGTLQESSVEELAQRWGNIQLAYAAPMLFWSIFGVVVLIAGFMLDSAINYVIDPLMMAYVAAVFIVVPIIQLSIKAWPLITEAGPKYLSMRQEYTRNNVAYVAAALQDEGVRRALRFYPQWLVKIFARANASKLARAFGF